MNDRMPHVVHIMRTLGHGGMEKNLRRVVLALEPRGIRHSILLLSERKDLLQFPPSVVVRRIVTRPRDPRLLFHLARHFRLLKPTVIHARNWATWPDTALARIPGAPRTPLIFSYHGRDEDHAGRRERLKFQAMARLTDRLFAVSDAARELLIDEYGLPRKRVGVIANGVDSEKFHPPPSPRGEKKNARLIIAAVGRFFPIKNFPLLMRAVRRLRDQQLDVELHLAGDGPNEQRLLQTRAELGLEDRVHMPGYVEDMNAFFHRADIFALSSDNEANPNALLEAMATALPAVSTDVGGAREVLDRGRCGLLVQAGDDRAMAEALASLARDPGLRDRLGNSARAHVVARYSQNKMYDAYERLYRDPLKADLD